MSTTYIDVPIVTDPDTLAQDAFDFIQAQIPGWVPNAGNLDTWLIEAFARMAAETATIASAVPASIFRKFGPLVGIQPLDATPATVVAQFTTVDNTGHTIPAGTLVGIPDADGNTVPFALTDTLVIGAGATTGNGTLVAVNAGAAGSSLGANGTVVPLLTTLASVSTVTLQGTTTGGLDAETDSDYLNRLAAELRLLAPRPILPDDFATLARTVAGVERALALDGYNPVHNLLTADEASFETGVSHWGGNNAVVAQSASQALDGSNSMRMTASSAADMWSEMLVANGKIVTPGEIVSALAYFRAATTGRTVKVGIQFVDASNVSVGGGYGTTVSDTNSGWVETTVQQTAPPTAAKALVVCFVTAPANAEQHYVDKVQLRRGGIVTDWVAGGTSDSTGNERMIAVALVDAAGNAASSAVKNAVQASLDAQREVNFVVNVIDPSYALIDVTFTITAFEGFDPAAVVDAAEAAVTAFLDPASWGLAPTRDLHSWINNTSVRQLDLAAIIKNTPGVAFITSLQLRISGGTLATTDVALPGAAPLPLAGAITGAHT
jgi:hypothetical protein